MQLITRHKFDKNLKKLNSPKLTSQAEQIKTLIQSAKSIYEIPNIKKMQGADDTYRIKLGDYRIGLRIIDDAVHLVCISLRDNAYNKFP
ncbi:MAG: type II toxin-antitoxin system RelE/ParE family toxin [Ignavibacteria bacterium]|jgi:mRNA interferase RelE/StbE|nr:type II toxin-antitoxin system RelE/ParE family toxin [Ignavibacteria bacterium]